MVSNAWCKFVREGERTVNVSYHHYFTVTYNALSVPRFKQLLEVIRDLRTRYHAPGKTTRLLFDTPYLRYPDHLSIQVLPKEFSKYFDEQIDFVERNLDPVYGFTELELMKLKRVREWMLQYPAPEFLKNARSDFKTYFKEHDRRRQTDFRKTFPEFADFYNNLVEQGEQNAD